MSDAGVTVTVRNDLGQVNLRGNASDTAFLAAVKSATDCDLPVAANRATGKTKRACWLGPDEWLLLLPAENTPAAVEALERKLADKHAAINDVSGGQVMLRLEGAAVRELLAKGCTLDLHPAEFTPGACAQTGLGKAGVTLLAHADGAGVDLVVRRSFSDYLLQWLRRAGSEYEIEFA